MLPFLVVLDLMLNAYFPFLLIKKCTNEYINLENFELSRACYLIAAI